MTSFQRLLKGLNVLNRFSGVTDVQTPSLTPLSQGVLLVIPFPTHLKLEARDVAALTSAGWRQDAQSWVFQP